MSFMAGMLGYSPATACLRKVCSAGGDTSDCADRGGVVKQTAEEMCPTNCDLYRNKFINGKYTLGDVANPLYKVDGL